MKYLFILGRNPQLSLAELNSIFEEKEIKINKNSALINLEKPLKEDIIKKLGGTISIGKVLCEVKDIDKEMIYLGKENKFNYVVWDFSEKTKQVSDYLKKRFKGEKLKTTEKRFTNIINLQGGEKAQNIGSKHIHEQYFVFEDYFGKIIQKCDYKSIEERDMKKPFKRESLSISPRLAKIMINLSRVEKSLVDSFCGVGVILQEALLQKIKVIGVDKDKQAVEHAKKNLEWFNFPKKDYEIFNADSKKISIKRVDVMVSEPDFGKILRKVPSKKEAKIMLDNFENLMIQVLNNMKKYVGKRFVFTAPLIRTGEGRKGCKYNKILDKTNLKLIKGFPIQEFRENQIVGREIFVLEQSL